MKQFLFILNFLILTATQAQVDTVDYKSFIKCRKAVNGVCVVENKKVTEKVYRAAVLHNDSLQKKRFSATIDKPVWLIMRYDNGKISSEGLWCGQCGRPVGLYMAYYENGNIKYKTLYAKVADEKELKKRKKKKEYDWCSDKDGPDESYDEKGQLEMIYYYEKGRIIRCERYKDGKIYSTVCG